MSDTMSMTVQKALLHMREHTESAAKTLAGLTNYFSSTGAGDVLITPLQNEVNGLHEVIAGLDLLLEKLPEAYEAAEAYEWLVSSGDPKAAEVIEWFAAGNKPRAGTFDDVHSYIQYKMVHA